MKRIVSLAAGISMLFCSTTAFAQLEAGHVGFVENEGAVSAEVLVTDLGENKEATLFLASYDAEDKLTGIQSASGTNAILSTGSLASGADSYKAYIWDKESLLPLQNAATKDSSNADLSGISLDGVPLDGFSAATTEYDVTLTGVNPVMPRITATAADNGSAVTVTEEVAEGGATATTTITVTPQTGDPKTYTINFSVDGATSSAVATQTHVIKGAESDEDFVTDEKYAADQTFNKTAATNAWIATGFHGNADFSRQGAAVKTDRDAITPTSNKMQIWTSENPDLEGLDYLIFGHGASGETTFTLTAPAEVIIASSNASLSVPDYQRVAEYSPITVIYENIIYSTTVYSLMKDYGLEADDFVKTGTDLYRLTAYPEAIADMAKAFNLKKQNTAYTDIYDKTPEEIAAYIASEEGELEIQDDYSMFDTSSIVFGNFYSRTYADVGAEGVEVTLPYANHTLVFIKPISGSETAIQPAVSDYAFLLPFRFAQAQDAGIFDASIVGDNAGGGQGQIMVAGDEGKLSKLENGTAAVMNGPGPQPTKEIQNINPLFSLAGKDFLVPSWNWFKYNPSWFAALYSGDNTFGGGAFKDDIELPAVDWVSFKLNRDATVMVVPMKNTANGSYGVPTFIDETWTQVKYADGSDVVVLERWWPDANAESTSTEVYMKDFEKGATVTLPAPQMKTDTEMFVIID